jgi:hypothetical protein
VVCGLWFVVPRVFSHSNKTPNQMQQSTVKFIVLLYRRCSTCFRHYYAHHQEPFQTVFAASGFRANAEVDVFPADHGWKHVHIRIHTDTNGCNGSLKGFLMMGIVMPKTC